MVTVDIVTRSQVPEAAIRAMLALHRRSFDSVEEHAFRRDLAEKDRVILLRDEAGAIVGFSTQVLITLEHEGLPRRFLFSGDTVVAREHRRQPGLAGAFGHLMLHLIERHGGEDLYWFLISKGFRTYRFLPVYFRSYHPGPDRCSEEAGRLAPLLDLVARHKFGEAWDPTGGVVRAVGPKEHLSDQAAAMHARRERDPHVRYFLDANPGWQRGDELACLAPITRENLNEGAWRVIERTEPRWVG
jgi:hypothetical protein